jgi:transposase-like protein
MEAALAAGKTVTEASGDCGVGLATYYVWRRDYGGMTPHQLKRVMQLEAEQQRLRKRIEDLSVDSEILRKVLSEQLGSPAARRRAVQLARHLLGVSERRACAALAVPRSSHRYEGASKKETAALVDAMRRLRDSHPRYGYRRIAALLREEGWSVSDIQVYRLGRREGRGSAQ